MAKGDKAVTKAPEATEALATTAPAGALAKQSENEYGEDAGAGLKELSANEKSIPFLNLLQANSPEVENNSPPGAKAGMFINSVTKELIDGEKGLLIRPVFVQRTFVEWIDRDKGGGVVARHLFTSAEVQDAIDRNGGSVIASKEKPLKHGENFLVDTRYLYCHVLNEQLQVEGYFVLAGAKSKVKPVQNFYSAIDQIKGGPPMWSCIARLTSFTDIQKKSGKQFKNVRFMPHIEGKSYADTKMRGSKNPETTPHVVLGIDRDYEKALFASGKKFYESIMGGKVAADFDTEGFEAVESEEATEKRHF